MSCELICVYRAVDLEEADIVAAWLEDHGIAVHVKDRYAAGTWPTPLIAAPKGIEVCILDPSKADRAHVLMREQLEQRQEKSRELPFGRTVEAACEDCGKSSPFPFGQRGSVQTCPHCRRFMDVPEA